MSDEIKLLTKAVEALNQEPDYFKDYVFPIASALFTSLLGAGIAYFTLRHQEAIQIEKEKMDTANKWLLRVEEARDSLIAIKANYQEALTEIPFERLLAIPSIFSNFKTIDEQYQSLSFVVPNEEEIKGGVPKWSQIGRIRAMVSNYNHLMELWQKRHELNQEFKGKLLVTTNGASVASISLSHAIAASSEAELVTLLDLNERAIKLTDDLILEFDSFLNDFPDYAKTKIKVKQLKRYGSVLTYSSNENQNLLNLIKRSPEVDFKSVEALFGQCSEQIKNRHSTGY